jgi:hypothetical protein
MQPDHPRAARVFRILELLKSPSLHNHIELGERLKGYRWSSRVSPSAQGMIEVIQTPKDVSGPRKWEQDAVRWLLNLLRVNGELDRVHKCCMYGLRPECAGWFYGRAYGSGERFCSKACKSYKRDHDPEVIADRKSKRRKARQAYSKRERAKDRRGMERVGFGVRVRHRAR